MTTGTPRRQTTNDSLAGMHDMQPVMLQGPGVSNPRAIRAPEGPSTTARIAQQLGQWAGGRLQEAVNTQQERRMMEGRMAQVQGETYESVEMGGDPWALEGYRFMDAQSLSSTLLAAQRAQIEQGGYASTPDQFRQQMGDRLEGMLSGVDARTAELVREQFTAHIPTLVADHTTQHLTHLEQENFRSLSTGIDVISRDPTATEQLLDFAIGGEGSASAGLSDERRQAAVVTGVLRAFENDNPLAYAALSRAGVLGDSLTMEQQRSIRAAQQAFENRRRSEFNAALFNGEQELMTRVENGELSPAAATEELSALYAQHGIEMTASEAGTIYADAQQGQRVANRTASFLIEDATLRGDLPAVARLSSRVLHGGFGVRVRPGQHSIRVVGDTSSSSDIQGVVGAAVETVLGTGARVQLTSGLRSGDRGSQHSTGHAADFAIFRADGSRVNWSDPEAQQVMEVAASMGALGFGAGPTYMGGNHFHVDMGTGGSIAAPRGGITVWSDDDGGPSDSGPGAAQWASSLRTAASGESGLSAQEAQAWEEAVTQYGGNVPHAALAFEFGQERADAFINGGEDAELEARASAIQERLDNWRAPTAADRLQIAQAQLQDTRQRLAMDTYEQMQPQVASLDDRLMRGDIDRQTWMQERRGLFDQYDVARTQADVDHEIGVQRRHDAALAAAAAASQDEQYQINLEQAQAQIVPHQLEFDRIAEDPASTPQQVRDAARQLSEQRQSIYDDAGIEVLDRQNGAFSEQMLTTMDTAMQRHRVWSEEQTQIDAASSLGYLGDLPRNLQMRAFQQQRERIQQHYSTEYAEGRMSEQEANEAIASDLNAFYAQAGAVDPQVAQQMNALAMSPLLDENNQPNPAVVDGIAQYAALRALNPSVAQSALSPEAVVRAEAVLSRAATPGMIPNSVRSLAMELRDNPIREETNAYLARQDVQESAERAVTHALETRDIGFLHAIWQGDARMDQRWDNSREATDRLWSQREQIQEGVMAEMGRLQRITPGIAPDRLADMALENYFSHTELIGGDIVEMPGINIRERFFGAQATDFQHDGDINSAVMNYLRSPEMREQYPFLNDSTWGEYLPEAAQGVLDFAAGLVPFADLSFQPPMSLGDTYDRIGGGTGVRPFRAMHAGGGNLAVQVLMPNGDYSDPIVIPSGEAGRMYMDRRRRQNIE